jgi:AraC-like DNA-binding protein
VGMRDDDPPGFVDPSHSHERAQLAYALEGTMAVTTDDSAFVLPVKRAIWIPAGVVHEVTCRGAVQLNVLYIDPTLGDMSKTCRVFDVSPLVQALIGEVLTFEHAYDVEGREGRIVTLLLEEITRMPEVPLSAPMPRDRRLRRVCDLIIAEPAHSGDLDELARIAGMGRRTLTRAFRAETGMALAMWRQQVRLMAALSMLGEGRPVTSIAYDVGYESPSSFTAMFHRVLGVPPSHYAKSKN